jgi:hypothetical protein
MTSESWLKSADKALTFAAEQIKLIRAVTPVNAESELALVERAFRRGSPRPPRWVYDGSAVPAELCLALEKLACFLEGLSTLGAVYAARARELFVEAAIIDSVGTPRLRARAEQRFIPRTEEARQDLAQADELAAAWTQSGCEIPESLAAHDRVRSCDIDNPSSLISRMSCEAGRQRLPVRVVLKPGLASLAATGDSVILVAPAKWIARRDVERTVLHEIAGHALPRARASGEELGIFALGTARGVDDQEGRALLIEESAGFLDARRRRELGLRHLAARATLEGQCFIDVVGLLRSRSATVEEAVRIAARVQRGGQISGGLAREIVYLPAYLRVRRAMCGPIAAVVERMMASGRIAVDVAPLLAKTARRAIERTGVLEKNSVYELGA